MGLYREKGDERKGLRKQMHVDAFWFGFQESFISATAMAMVLYVKVGCL